MDENMLVWDENGAIEFIAARCDIDKKIIAKVLELEAEYMESAGIAELQRDSKQWEM